MVSIRDIVAQYETVESIWGKIRADAISHAFLLIGLFLVIGVTLPDLTPLQVDVEKILGSNYYKFAKDTGLILLTNVIVLAPFFVYILLLRLLGRLFVLLWVSVFQPVNERWLASSNIRWHLAQVAVTLQKEMFLLSDIALALGEMVLLYKGKRKDEYEGYQQSAQSLGRNATIYLGNAGVFLVAWVVLFVVLPDDGSWKRANEEHFWPGFLLLSAFVLWGWLRTRNMLSALPVLTLGFVSAMIRSDQDQIRPDDATLEKAIIRVEALQKRLWRPSLVKFILVRIGCLDHREAEERDEERERAIVESERTYVKERVRGRPFPEVYNEGREFAESPDRKQDYEDSEWLGFYVSYLYYRLHRGFQLRLVALWHLLLFLVRGTP